MPSTRADAISYVEKSDMHESDKVYWRGQQTPFQPELTLTLSHRASGFQTTDRTFAGVKARLYTKTSHAKTSLLVVIPGGTSNTLLSEQSAKQLSQGPQRAESIGMRILRRSVAPISIRDLYP